MKNRFVARGRQRVKLVLSGGTISALIPNMINIIYAANVPEQNKAKSYLTFCQVLPTIATHVNNSPMVVYIAIIKSATGNILVIFSKPCDDFVIDLDPILKLSTVLTEKF